MDTTPKTVAMEGAAWLVSFILSFTREKWIEKEMANRYLFFDKPDSIKRLMIGQVWDIANKMENGNSPGTAKKSKKR